MKTRKVELIVYGYGKRVVYDLTNLDLGVFNEHVEKFMSPYKIHNLRFSMDGYIKSLKLIKGREK